MVGVAACGSSAAPAAKHAALRVQSVAGTEFGPDVLEWIFPRDGEDLAQAVPVQDFTLGVDEKQQTQCLAAAGFPGPGASLAQESLAQLAYGNNQMPNLPLMEQTHTVGNDVAYRLPPGPIAGMSSSERTAYKAMSATCMRRSFSLARVLDRPAPLALVTAWSNVTAQVLSSAAVRAQNARGAACSKGTAFAGNSVAAVYGKIASSVFRGHTVALVRARAEQADGVRVLARCFSTDIGLQARLLSRRRAAFFAANASAIKEIVTSVNEAVARLERAGVAPRSVEAAAR